MGCISEKVVNKNLFDYNNNARGIGSSATISSITKNGFILKGTGAWGNYGLLFANKKKNIDYYLSMKILSTLARKSGFTVYGTNNLNFSSSELTTLVTNTQDISANVNADCGNTFNSGSYEYLLIRFWNNATGTALSESVDLEFSEIMLADGTTAGEYQPHQEQTFILPVQQPMRKIGDVKDCFFKNTIDNPLYDSNLTLNGWYERHNIGVGNEDNFSSIFNMGTTLAEDLYGFACNNSLNIASNYDVGAIVSNIFVPKLLGSTTDTTNINNVRFNMGIAINSANKQIIITLKKTYLSEQTQTALKTFLGNKNFYFYYQFATPTNLPCTSEQTSILEQMVKSYPDVTHIFSEDGIPIYFDATALKA